MNDCIFHRAGESNNSPAPLHAISALVPSWGTQLRELGQSEVKDAAGTLASTVNVELAGVAKST
jgi:hypothetical protein